MLLRDVPKKPFLQQSMMTSGCDQDEDCRAPTAMIAIATAPMSMVMNLKLKPGIFMMMLMMMQILADACRQIQREG